MMNKKFISLFVVYFLIYIPYSQSQSLLGAFRNIYVYNEGRDTLFLSQINAGEIHSCDTLRVTNSIQIDGLGSEELVLHRTCSGFTSSHGGTFDIEESISISKYEIWNLDTKEMIFEAKYNYHNDYNKFQAYEDPQHKKGVESYSYDLEIDSVGRIIISNVKKHSNASTFVWKTISKKGKSETLVEEIPYQYEIYPDKAEGVYLFVNGKYVME